MDNTLLAQIDEGNSHQHWNLASGLTSLDSLSCLRRVASLKREKQTSHQVSFILRDVVSFASPLLHSDMLIEHQTPACFRLYNPRGPNDRLAAEQILSPLFPTFAESTFGTVNNANPSVPTTPYETVIHCEMVLERSQSPYAHTFVTGHFKTLVTGHFSLFSATQKIELSKFRSWSFEKSEQHTHTTSLVWRILSAFTWT